MSLLKVIIKALDDLNAIDLKIYDLKGMSPLFDHMVIATASNERLAWAMVKHIKDDAVEAGYDVKGIEGKDGSWILLDLKDVIVNIFNDEQREFYGLDKLNIGNKQINIKDILNGD